MNEAVAGFIARLHMRHWSQKRKKERKARMEEVTVVAATTVEPGTEQAVLAAVVPEVEKTTNVLVAIDDSDESFHALRWAVENILRRQTPPAVVTVVHVMEPLPRHAFTGAIAETAKKENEQNAARILSRAYEICRENSLNAKTLILEGDPKDSICKAVEEMNINLLVVGSRGLGQIKRAFLGSVSDYCIHHAKCPVLIVKPPRGRRT